ncbi:ABC transporter permease [Paenibacillus hodogayensis]|uniref:Putative hemin transport system permease protein HrtB n=1 Tax=Paenibacillus hodogayensis TaxID=279208 RepID=A0ABV5W138_9BACL
MSQWMLLARNIAHRKTLSLLTVAAVAVTIALFALLILFRDGVERGAQKGYGPFDIVIGAEGSESQLVLSTFFRVGSPTGNIPASVWASLKKEEQAEAAFAMTTGDQHNGYPIVGVDPGYFQIRYGDRQLAKGKLYSQLGEVTLGYDAAKRLNAKIGDTFSGAHGLAGHLAEEHDDEEEDGHEHEDAHHAFRYTVVGVLPKLGTPDDRAVFTTLDYAWAVHELPEDRRDVTAVMIKPKTLLGAQMIKQKYDKINNVQAVYTSKAIADVLNVVDTGSQLLQIVMAVCVVLAALSLLLSLTAAVNERKKDVGLLRLVGKPGSFIWLCLVGEGALLTAVGVVVGLALGHISGWLIGDAVFSQTGVRIISDRLLASELWIAAGALAIGAAASAVPAFRIYKVGPMELFRS